MNFELLASLMCADYGNLEREVGELDRAASTPSTSTSWTAGSCRILRCP